MSAGQDTAIVHLVTATAGATRWRPTVPGSMQGLEERYRFSTWEPLQLTLDGPRETVPTFSWIEGVTYAYLFKLHEEAPEWFGIQSGRVLDLAGDAAGFGLVLPVLCPSIDVENSSGLDDDEPEHWEFNVTAVSENLFRSVPRHHDIYCGEFLFANDEQITDVDHYSNMNLRIWTEITGATGMDFTELWRGPHNLR